MKKTFFIGLLFLSVFTFGQSVKVPDAVLKNFEELFPEAEDVSWKQLKINYQATFESSETTMALFNPEGKWLKTAVIISEDELPLLASEHISENYEDAEITQIQMIENNKEETSYLVIIYYNDEKIKIKFDEEGIVIEK